MLPSYSTPPSTPSMPMCVSTPISTPTMSSTPSSSSSTSSSSSSSSCCQVCSSTTASWHYGAIACEACKKFFIRSHVNNRFLNYACVLAHGKCEITLKTRSMCQYCRWNKCRRMGMYMRTTTKMLKVAAAATSTPSLAQMMDAIARLSGGGGGDAIDNSMPPVQPFALSMASTKPTQASVIEDSFVPTRNDQELSVELLIKTTQCAVCSAKSSGVHFGVITCEACKAFFRRALKSGHHTAYKCMSTINNGSTNGGSCAITTGNRTCRACRFAKCLQVGMASENSKVGRKSNITKQQLYSKRRFEQQRQQKWTEKLEQDEVNGDDDSDEMEDGEDEFSQDSAKRIRFDGTVTENASVATTATSASASAYSSAMNRPSTSFTSSSSHSSHDTCVDYSTTRLRYQQYCLDANLNPYQQYYAAAAVTFPHLNYSTGHLNNHSN